MMCVTMRLTDPQRQHVHGSTTGKWTTDMFVEAAYQSLSTPARR